MLTQKAQKASNKHQILRLLVVPAGLMLACAAILMASEVPRPERELRQFLRFAAKVGLVLVPLAVAGAAGARAWLGPAGARRLGRRLALLGLSLSFGLVVAEVGVRVALRDVTTTWDNSSYFARRFHARHPPMQNSLGFREREVPAQPPAGAYRIAVIGDSYTYGQGVREADRFTERLAAALNTGDRTYEVYNFGRPGAETHDHVTILREAVLAHAPDFVLLQWFVNDVEVLGGEAQRQPMRLLPSDYAVSLAHRSSALFWLLNDAWRKFQGRIARVGTYEDYLVRRFRDPDGPPAHAAREALLSFLRTCRHAETPVGVVLFPHLTEGMNDDYALGFLLDRVAATCASENVPYVDLRTTYAGIEPASRLWANRVDPHPGPLAHRLGAEALLQEFGPLWGAANTPPPAGSRPTP